MGNWWRLKLNNLFTAAIVVCTLVHVDARGRVVGVRQEAGQAAALPTAVRVQAFLFALKGEFANFCQRSRRIVSKSQSCRGSYAIALSSEEKRVQKKGPSSHEHEQTVPFVARHIFFFFIRQSWITPT